MHPSACLLALALASSDPALRFERVDPAGDSVGGEQVGFDLIDDGFALIDNEERLGPELVEIHLWSMMDEESGNAAVVYRIAEGEYDPAAVYASRDARTVLVGIADGGRLLKYEVFDPRTGEDFGRIDAALVERSDTSAQLSADAPAALVARLAASTPRPLWKTLVHREHAYDIEHWNEHINSTSSKIAALEDASLKSGLEIVAELIQQPYAVVDAAALIGDWRCRSLQGSDYGLFVYNDFKCRIEAGADGTLKFAKLTGSQRRSGVLYPHGEPGQYVFLGGATVNEDPLKAYSRIIDSSTHVIEESDTYGLLFARSKNELVLVLDPSYQGYELYQLRR